MADYAIYVVAVALVAPLVFTLWFAAHVGWRQKRVLGRYVHWRGEDRL